MPSFNTNFSEKRFISARTYEKHIVCTDYCIAHHDNKSCCLPACKYHIMLLGNVEELPKRLDKFSFTYQHVDCLYTLIKYRFSAVFAKTGQVFDNVQRAVDFNQRNKGVDRKPSIAKKDALAEKVQKAFLQLLPKGKNNADQWLSVCRKNWKTQKDYFWIRTNKNCRLFSWWSW